jgi:hypothetical protein
MIASAWETGSTLLRKLNVLLHRDSIIMKTYNIQAETIAAINPSSDYDNGIAITLANTPIPKIILMKK